MTKPGRCYYGFVQLCVNGKINQILKLFGFVTNPEEFPLVYVNLVLTNPFNTATPLIRPDFCDPLLARLGSFNKPRRRRQRERHRTKGLMCRTMVLHLRFESLYISLPSSAKEQREMTKSYVFWRTCTAMANFSCLPLELNAVNTYIA